MHNSNVHSLLHKNSGEVLSERQTAKVAIATAVPNGTPAELKVTTSAVSMTPLRTASASGKFPFTMTASWIAVIIAAMVGARMRFMRGRVMPVREITMVTSAAALLVSYGVSFVTIMRCEYYNPPNPTLWYSNPTFSQKRANGLHGIRTNPIMMY